jgi:Zn-dependent alcohol dehydrogenase
MKGCVLRAAGASRPYSNSKPIAIETLPIPEPREGEVLVKIILASLCHSDLSVVDGTRVRPLPMLLGHEAAGIVIKANGCNGVSPGDHVVTLFVGSCKSCKACRGGRGALCYRGAASNGSGDLLHGSALLKDANGVSEVGIDAS